MLAFAATREEKPLDALPEVDRETEKLPRSYIANVIHTIVGEPFAKWVSKRMDERNAKRTKEKDMIQMDPEIAQIYHSSTAISSKFERQ